MAWKKNGTLLVIRRLFIIIDDIIHTGSLSNNEEMIRPYIIRPGKG